MKATLVAYKSERTERRIIDTKDGQPPFVQMNACTTTITLVLDAADQQKFVDWIADNPGLNRLELLPIHDA